MSERRSGQRALAWATALLVLVVAVLLVREMRRPDGRYYASIEDAVSDESLVGQRVSIGGAVDEWLGRKSDGYTEFILAPEGADRSAEGPRILVRYRGTASIGTMGEGVVAIAKGRLVSPGVLESDDLITKQVGPYAAPDRISDLDPEVQIERLLSGYGDVDEGLNDTLSADPGWTYSYPTGVLTDEAGREYLYSWRLNAVVWFDATPGLVAGDALQVTAQPVDATLELAEQVFESEWTGEQNRLVFRRTARELDDGRVRVEFTRHRDDGVALAQTMVIDVDPVSEAWNIVWIADEPPRPEGEIAVGPVEALSAFVAEVAPPFGYRVERLRLQQRGTGFAWRIELSWRVPVATGGVRAVAAGGSVDAGDGGVRIESPGDVQ